MKKEFIIIKKENLLNEEKTVCAYVISASGKSNKALLEKYQRIVSNKDNYLYRYSFDEKLNMHLIPGISKQTVMELSKHLYHYAYVVCKLSGKDEKVLFLSPFKDVAMKFKNSIPSAILTKKGVDYYNPKFYVKEISLFIWSLISIVYSFLL